MDSASCPHCGKTLTDLFEYGMTDEESITDQCGYCEKDIVISCHVSVDYEIKKAEGKADG